MQQSFGRVRWSLPALCAIPAMAFAYQPTLGGDEKPEFPDFKDVAKDYEKVVSTADGKKSLYTLYLNEKEGELLAELPAGYAGQNHYVAMTVPTGELFAGLQSGELYGSWKRFGKRVALISPDMEVRSTGDMASKDSIKNHYTDRVVVDVPIVCMGPGGQPVIDFDDLLVGKASSFYGRSATGLKKALASVVQAKAFPENIEVAFEVPASDGRMRTFHYSFSLIPENTGYQPRDADERVGYFTTSYRDLGKFRDDEVWNRKINRWKLEKADPSLKLSPPKEPITFYLEHTVPIRYRRWVKEGVLYWNEAFEKVGISDAVVVHYQDKASGAHMEKDPEDVRYNFIRWLSNDIGTAIGPSRAHPATGQILDADIVLTDGWIRHFWNQSNEFLPDIAMEGFSSETMNWLEDHPDWDPRVRLAAPEERSRILEERKRSRLRGEEAYQLAFGDGAILASEELRDLASELEWLGVEPMLCMASTAKAQSMALMGMTMEMYGLLDEDEEGEEDKDKEDEPDRIDGVPEWFIGPMLADLVAHEVGHTIGLRHNFKSSSLYTMAEINSEAFKGKKPFAGSVMDYIPVNVNMQDGEVQGDFAMIGVGPYDMWAIEYGYGFGDPKKVLERVAEPELAYLTDEDTSGPDPYARRYDFAKDPLEYCESRMRLANYHRERIIEKFVKDGDSWSKARRGYDLTLGIQTGSLSVMANWLGGAFINRDRKGDPNGRLPIEVVPVADQRKALAFVIKNAFLTDSFGIDAELLKRMTVDKWYDGGGMRTVRSDPTYPVHDRIAGIQASALTQLMNPSTLRRVYDNEFYLPAGAEALTLTELMGAISGAIWADCGYEAEGLSPETKVNEAASPKKAAYSPRQPMISSLRRNLQREHLERLIDLALEDGGSSASMKTISLLARSNLIDLQGSIEASLAAEPDAYSRAHLQDAKIRIGKVLDASYSYNAGGGGGGGSIIIQFGKETDDN